MRSIQESLVIFLGTEKEALGHYRALTAKGGLNGAEEFVLLRYLDLPIPDDLQERYSFIENARYERIFAAVLAKLPSEAKQEIDAI